MLSRSALAKQQDRTAKIQSQSKEWPSVALLLEIDREYRKRVKKDELHKIAPRRFNPDHEVWLPVMHTKRQGWSFTVMYSNTAQAHQLAKTDDWVVIYYEQADKEQQNTVVTETQGALKGKRVVRGRDAESQEHYRVRIG
jgi:putative hydrolase